jgi:phytoene synthase
MQSANKRLPTPHTDMAHCRRLLCSGSRSFHIASQLLPNRLREAACGLYAFCREADDLIDQGRNPSLALQQLSKRLDAIYIDQPLDYPVDRVLAQIVADHCLPRTLLDALLEGFAWDAQDRHYHTLDELLEYCARVAGAVGVMMATLMGVREADTLARAADLGTAMQLTNIARDIGEDARNGRLYVPTELLEDSFNREDFLAYPAMSPALNSAIAQLLAEAERLYERADSGIAALPRSFRSGIYAARLLYSEIGQAIARDQCDPVTARSIVSGWRKLQLIAKARKATHLCETHHRASALDANQYLIDAVVDNPQGTPLGAPRRFSPSISWTLDLFAALAAREQQAITRQRTLS